MWKKGMLGVLLSSVRSLYEGARSKFFIIIACYESLRWTYQCSNDLPS